MTLPKTKARERPAGIIGVLAVAVEFGDEHGGDA
jgi:hypothetical protein